MLKYLICSAIDISLPANSQPGSEVSSDSEEDIDYLPGHDDESRKVWLTAVICLFTIKFLNIICVKLVTVKVGWELHVQTFDILS